MSQSNGTAPKANVCPERKQADAEHCWHSAGQPIPNPTTRVVTFSALCCFCAPTYTHLVVWMPSNIPDEELVAAQMMHGHLVSIKRQPKQGPSLMVPRG